MNSNNNRINTKSTTQSFTRTKTTGNNNYSFNSRASSPEMNSDDSDNELKRTILPVFNENNNYLTEDNLRNIFELGNISVEKIDRQMLEVFQKAFIHKSYCLSTYNDEDRKKNEKYYGTIDVNLAEYKDCIPLQNSSNEVIEWLGDGIIQSVSAIYLFDRFKTQQEGFLTKIRSKLVKTESLSKLALALGFDKYLIISKHIDVLLTGRKNARILEDCFEAFIGSMMTYFSETSKKDAFDICYRFIVNVIEKTIDITELIMNDDNFKDRLMKYFQKKYDGKFPVYEQNPVIQSVDKNGIVTKKFSIYIKDINGKTIGQAIAKSKKEAEQMAAKQALMFFGITNE